MSGANYSPTVGARDTHSSVYGTSGRYWWLLPPTGWTDDQILSKLERQGEMQDRNGWRCHTHQGDCCGRWFGYKAKVRRTKTRTLVTQYVGLDI